MFVLVWGRGPLSSCYQHCSPHHWNGGKMINLRNNETVSLWSLPLVWLHVLSNKKGSGLEWNWNRRMLMPTGKKLILTNQLPLPVSDKWILGNSKSPMLTAPRLWCKQSFWIAQCSLEFLRRLLVHVQHVVVLGLDAVAVWGRFWHERRPRGTRKL